MTDLELSVTICSWNTVTDLRICLASLYAVRNEARFEVLVVDNNSEDGSASMVREAFPWVRLFAVASNLGFTGGHNYLFAQRAAPHVFCLNSDTVVHPGALRQLLDYVGANPQVGIVGPKLLNPDGTLQYSCRRFPNPVAALFRNTPVGKLFPNNHFTRDYLMQDWDHNSVREVDWVSGAAFIATSSLIDEVGTFDPEYFMFCEDVDWCWRAWKANFKVVYLPSAVVTHAIGRSTDKAPNRMIGGFHKSMLRFYAKNVLPEMPTIVRPLLYAFAAASLALRAGTFIAKNRLDERRRRRA
jgi:GT2 family glycosyltransferase